MIDVSKGPNVFLRYGMSRKKKFLQDVRNAYDGLVLPGNILLYQYKATPSVVYMCKQPFFVDPMSYLMGQPFKHFTRRTKKENSNFKPSFERLLEGHGFDPSKVATTTTENFIEELLSDKKLLDEFVKETLGFQYDNVWETISNSKNLMDDEEQESLVEGNYRPLFVVPPYFIIDSVDAENPLLKLNQKILTSAGEQSQNFNAEIFPLIYLRKSLLKLDQVEALSGKIPLNFPGYIFWVEDFDERRATEDQVKAIIKLVDKLAGETNKPVIALHGGFYTMLLYAFGLAGVSHGTGYGESRSGMATARRDGGPPPVRYYVKDLHCFLTLEKAVALLRDRPDLMCSCQACNRVTGGNPENITRYSDQEELAEIHFLINRNQEKTLIFSNSRKELVDYLDFTLDLYGDLNKVTLEKPSKDGSVIEEPVLDPSFIKVWKNALNESG